MAARLSVAHQQAYSRDMEFKDAADTQRSHSFPAEGLHSNSDLPRGIELGGWQLHMAEPCRLARKVNGLESGSSAKHWLQTFRRDTYATTAMRKVLLAERSSTPLSRMRDDDVIEQVAQLLKSRRWHVCEPVMQLYPVTAVKARRQAAVTPFPRRAPTQSEPPLLAPGIPDEATLKGNADQAAMAAVLTQAATHGAPFCKECAKAG